MGSVTRKWGEIVSFCLTFDRILETSKGISISWPCPDSTIYFPEAATTSVYSAETTLPLHKNASYPYLGQVVPASEAAYAPGSGSRCVVIPCGWGLDDSSQILAAVERCGVNGTITLPAPYIYTISRRMYMRLSNSRLEILGTLSFTPDLLYWIDNSFRVEF